MRSNIIGTLALGGLCFFLISQKTALAQGREPSCVIGGENLHPLMETHTLPPYPVESIHQNEEGTVLMDVAIEANGVPTGVKTAISSGFPRLDEAAGAWVQKQWRWQPFRGKCAKVVTRVSVKWDLKSANLYPSLTRSTPYEGQSVTDFLLNH